MALTNYKSRRHFIISVALALVFHTTNHDNNAGGIVIEHLEENYSVCCALCVPQTDRQADSSSEDIILCAHCQYRFLTDRPGVLALENLLAVHYWGKKKK